MSVTRTVAYRTVAEVEKLASVPTGKPKVEEILPAADFGPPAGPPDFGNSAHLGDYTVIYGNSCEHKKARKTLGLAGFLKAPPVGLEPTTNGLTVRRSTN